MSIIRADSIKNRVGDGAPDFPNGITVTGIVTASTLNSVSNNIDVDDFISVGNNIHLGNAGVVTATSFNGNISGTTGAFSGAVSGSTGTFTGNVSVGGTLTYEDVTNIDSVGLVTARDGLIVTGVTTSTAADIDDFISVGSNIHLGNAGIITASSFVDDGTNLLTEINTKATTGKAIAMAMIFG